MSIELESLDARANPRYLTRIAIFYGPYQKKILTDYSINMSTGGVFIETNMILPEDTELTVKFNLPNSDIIISVKARVAWINDPLTLKKESLPPGMGVAVPNPFYGRYAHHQNVFRYWGIYAYMVKWVSVTAQEVIMRKCDYIEQCEFFDIHMPHRPATATIYRGMFCEYNPNKCARFLIAEALGFDKVPTDLFPTMREKVNMILEVELS